MTCNTGSSNWCTRTLFYNTTLFCLQHYRILHYSRWTASSRWLSTLFYPSLLTIALSGMKSRCTLSCQWTNITFYWLLSTVHAYLNFHDMSKLQLTFHTVTVGIEYIKVIILTEDILLCLLMFTAIPLHHGHPTFFMTNDCGLVHRPPKLLCNFYNIYISYKWGCMLRLETSALHILVNWWPLEVETCITFVTYCTEVLIWTEFGCIFAHGDSSIFVCHRSRY